MNFIAQHDRQLHVQLACLWEATARKPGNVHRFADFPDLCYVDFLASAAAIAPELAIADRRSLGASILTAVTATRGVVQTNTNLGMILLLAPLCAVPRGRDLRSTVPAILEQTTVDDARQVYHAIRLANPGGLGRVDEQDVAGEPTLPLHEIMNLAAERDLIARQFANGFRDVFEVGVRSLVVGLDRFAALEDSIIYSHLNLLAAFSDSLIVRNHGQSVASEVQRRAGQLLKESSVSALAQFDRWLRGSGKSRNPGATADLVAASLFVALREDKISLPLQIPWTSSASNFC